MVTLVTNTTDENKDCSDLWVNFTCISSEANPPVYNYQLSDDEDGFSFSKTGTWVKKISREGKSIYNCSAYQLVENVTSARNITLTVNGKRIKLDKIMAINSASPSTTFLTYQHHLYTYFLLFKCASSWQFCCLQQNI